MIQYCRSPLSFKFLRDFGNANRVARNDSECKMIKNARQFLLNEVLTYYRETIAPELYCLGVQSDRFIPKIEELAQEIAPEIALSEHQQTQLLEQISEIGVAMFECDRDSDLEAYKIRLKQYLVSCCKGVSL